MVFSTHFLATWCRLTVTIIEALYSLRASIRVYLDKPHVLIADRSSGYHFDDTRQIKGCGIPNSVSLNG